MPIQVTCPGCHVRFQVSDKFAGRTGACPKCKTAIHVPAENEQVTVHAPEDFDRGGRSATSGKLVLKPIARTETRFTLWLAVTIVGTAAVAVLGAWLGGEILRESIVVRAAGLVVLSPVLVLAAYTFLRDPELEPYRGRALALRCGLCSLGYAVLWAVFAYTAGRAISGDPWSWFLVGPPFVVTGGLVALGTLDLDFGGALFHYGFYVLVTIVLRWIAGMGWIWEIGVL